MIQFWRRLWDLTRPYKGRFILGAIACVMGGLVETLVLMVCAFVVGTVFLTADGSGPSWLAKLPSTLNWLKAAFVNLQSHMANHVADSKIALILLVSLIPCVMLLRGIINYLNSYLMNWVAIRAVCDLRARMFNQMQEQPLSFLAKMSTPELMSRVNDAGMLQNMIAVSMVTIIREPVTAVTLFIAACALDWKLTLIALAVLSLSAFPIVIYNKKVRKAGADNQTEQAALAKVMHEAFIGNRIIKAYNLEKIMRERFNQTLKRFASHYMRVVRGTESPGPIIEFIGAVAVAILLIYLKGTNSATASAGFIVALLSMYKPIKATIRVVSQFHQARGAADRLFELLDTPNGMPDPPNPVPLKAAGADIHFDNVSFGYGEKQILHGIGLRVEPGQMVAIVGETGSGKSTVTNLLLRFYDPTDGAVRIGGVDIRAASLRDLRSQIAVVTQDVILFNDTIAHNIAYGKPGATQAQIEEAARHALAHEFILEKPNGYNSVVGERGLNLSGGQRQRLSIARAIIKDAPILILDEATNSLDPESERLVQKALDELMKGRTTICVAHRFSTVRNADVIVVVDRGEIVEMGRHEELLQREGVYHKLYSLSLATGHGPFSLPAAQPIPQPAMG